MKRPVILGFVLAFAMLCATYSVSDAQEVDENGDLIVVPEKPPDPLGNLKLIASYVLGAVGVVVIGLNVMKTYSTNFSYPASRMMLTNFLRQNPYQLVVIGKKAEGTITEPVVAALKVGGMIGPMDLKTIQSATLPTYDAAGKGMVQKFGATMTICKMAVTAAATGAIVAITAGRYLPVLLGALAGIGFLRIWLFRNELESQVMRGRAEILPEVDAAVMAGRFHTPPVIPQ